jgi:hypothetical protein
MYSNYSKSSYRSIDINGDGIVDSHCDASTFSPPQYPIPGSVGNYSGEDMLPETLGNLYSVSSSYQLMNETDRNVKNINKNGLIPVQCGYVKVATPYCDKKNPAGKGYFYPNDGRVIDPIRNIPLILDRLAESGSVHVNDVAKFDNTNYGSKYKSYSDIKNGQITYYTDSSTDQPFYAPVYTISSTVDKVIRKDPMDSVKAEYIRTPITTTMNSVSRDQFTKDALSHREDLMSLQQNLYNRTKWTARWK